jgi:hypothetical protein
MVLHGFMLLYALNIIFSGCAFSFKLILTCLVARLCFIRNSI